MEKDQESRKKFSGLRKRAEAFLDKTPSAVKKVPPEDVRKLVEELRIHQIELEMQNEELRWTQLQLQEARDKYSGLYDFAPVGYFTMSEKGEIQEANLTGAAMLGKERGKLINLPFTLFITADTQDVFYHHQQKIIETRTKQSCELRLKKEVGSEFWARLECAAVPDDQGDIRSFRVAVSDIEARKKDQKTLENAKKEWESTFDAISDWVSILDLQHRVVRSNLSVKAWMGIPVEEVLGKTCCPVVHGPGGQVPGCPFERMLKTGNRESTEFHVPEKERWFLVTVDPLVDDEGNLTGAVHIVRDITALKKEDEERAKIEKLESLGVLAGGLAHDFNNALAIIIGNVSCAGMEAVSTADSRKYLQEAEAACLRATYLTKQLLTFSKGGSPVKEMASLRDVVTESAEFALTGSNVSCDYIIPSGIWPSEIDAGQINRVIHNLVINADQAMPGGGIIEIRMDNRAIGAEDALPVPSGDYIQITLKDHGIGIPKTHLSKIFDPYFSTKDKGSGLGLATAHSVIQKHGGCIRVDSEPGIGTAFEIFLPATRKEIAAAGEEKRALPRGKGRILVMDDEEQLRKLADMMLGRLGYQVALTKDGDEAVEKYMKAMEEGEPFHAVILDLTIPGGMGGREAMGRLREMDPNVKGIVSSGYSNNPVMAYFSDYGFSRALKKPYKMDALARAVRDVLSGD